MNKTDLVELLTLFCEKADKLDNSRFGHALFDQDKICSFGTNPDGTVKFVTPNDQYRDELDAFMLTYRLFLQNNDKISFRNVLKAFAATPSASDYLRYIAQANESLNRLLDTPLIIRWEGAPKTFRELHDTIVNGELVHLNTEKAANYKKWSKDPRTRHFMWEQFLIALRTVLSVKDAYRFNSQLFMQRVKTRNQKASKLHNT